MTLNRTELRTMPRAERAEAIEALALEEFRRVLLMEPDEELPLEVSYFDLGLTSLRLTEIKQNLEILLDLTIDATVLFNRPTVEQLVEYLSERLAEPVAAPAG
ncbi:acyl carrier protein [Streptomyces jumonjinensis]|uniref:Acyl carrier protein n=2 Tax=Streptomyces jumonjinensis TaxID=1945 RepID=A0A646KJ33_STRJU|nr:acyl carrier protein [Streptomyces jumonjinensis]